MVDFFYTGDYTDNSNTNQHLSSYDIEHGEEEGITALRTHAKMFALADIYEVDQLQSLAAAKYEKAVEEISHIQDLLDSTPDIYGLIPDSVRTLREIAVTAVRIKLGHQSAAAWARSSEGRSGAAAYSVMALLDTGATGTLEFEKDSLSSYV